MTDQQHDDERIMLEEVPLVIEVNYHNEPEHPADMEDSIELWPGYNPFILFQMKQREGAVVLEVEASMIDTEDDLIETLETFFETMLQERAVRAAAQAEQTRAALAAFDLDGAVDNHFDEELTRANEDATIRDMGGDRA